MAKFTISARLRGSYHHGSAKSALVTAATELLESTGVTGLSLRQVAQRARLSRQAPYNHFADKEALLAELVRIGFERLASALDGAGDVADSTALSRAAEIYIGFALATPALFRLMFAREHVELDKFPQTALAGAAAFARLSAIIARFAAPERVADLSLAAWSLVHGYSVLCIEKALEPQGMLGERARFFAQLIQGEAEVPGTSGSNAGGSATGRSRKRCTRASAVTARRSR